MSLDQKKQLLWGSKSYDQDRSSIYWETAQFQTEQERNKFHRLMVTLKSHFSELWSHFRV